MCAKSINRAFSSIALFLVISLIPYLRLIIAPAFAQEEPPSKSDKAILKEGFDTLKTSLEEIKKELVLIRQLLSQRPLQATAPARAESDVSFANNPVLGKKDAPIALIEFSDYQCTYCKRFFETTLPALKTEYIDTGKIQYIFRDFPLEQRHAQARKAAEAAHCAGDQGKYWEMHDVIFQNQHALQPDKLKEYARKLALDPARFDACLDNGKYTTEVKKDSEDGMTAGVQGTPAFFIGKIRPDKTIRGTLISGVRPITVFRREIDRLLQESQ